MKKEKESTAEQNQSIQLNQMIHKQKGKRNRWSTKSVFGFPHAWSSSRQSLMVPSSPFQVPKIYFQFSFVPSLFKLVLFFHHWPVGQLHSMRTQFIPPQILTVYTASLLPAVPCPAEVWYNMPVKEQISSRDR